MGPAYISKEMTYTAEQIAARNARIDGFCTKILPHAREAFEAAIAPTAPSLEAGFIKQRGEDLANAIAYFWESLSEKNAGARIQLLEDIHAGRNSENVRAFSLIASRYYLKPQDAAPLLGHLAPQMQ